MEKSEKKPADRAAVIDAIADDIIKEGADPAGDPGTVPGGADPADNKTARVLRSTVLKLEMILNESLKSRSVKMAFSDDDLKQHSDLLCDVLEKHLTIDLLKNSPEFALAAYTVVMVADKIPVFNELRKDVGRPKPAADDSKYEYR